MIRYALKCSEDHDFDSWFKSAEAYDSLVALGHVACPICGGTKVAKALMAPGVSQSKIAFGIAETDREKSIAELRRKVEANCEYVGVNFVAEARKMHAGTAPERSIYGEARPEDAIKLLEDGVPLAPLPFMPARKVN